MPQAAASAASLCEPHRAFIEAQLRLGRNAMAIYQELVDVHAFAGRYNSVKRFVARTRIREPEQFDRLSFLPGEEMQADYDEGAPTRVPGRPAARRAGPAQKPADGAPLQALRVGRATHAGGVRLALQPHAAARGLP